MKYTLLNLKLCYTEISVKIYCEQKYSLNRIIIKFKYRCNQMLKFVSSFPIPIYLLIYRIDAENYNFIND